MWCKCNVNCSKPRISCKIWTRGFDCRSRECVSLRRKGARLNVGCRLFQAQWTICKSKTKPTRSRTSSDSKETCKERSMKRARRSSAWSDKSQTKRRASISIKLLETLSRKPDAMLLCYKRSQMASTKLRTSLSLSWLRSMRTLLSARQATLTNTCSSFRSHFQNCLLKYESLKQDKVIKKW